MDREPRFAHLIHQAHRCLFRAVDRELRASLGISSTQLGVLYYLHEHPDCSLSTLSDGLMLNNSAITGVVARMRKTGLVERRVADEDRRAARVLAAVDRVILPVQQFHRDVHHREAQRPALQAVARPLLDRFTTTLRAGFSEAELDTVRRFLARTTDRFSALEDTTDER